MPPNSNTATEVPASQSIISKTFGTVRASGLFASTTNQWDDESDGDCYHQSDSWEDEYAEEWEGVFMRKSSKHSKGFSPKVSARNHWRENCLSYKDVAPLSAKTATGTKCHRKFMKPIDMHRQEQHHRNVYEQAEARKSNRRAAHRFFMQRHESAAEKSSNEKSSSTVIFDGGNSSKRSRNRGKQQENLCKNLQLHCNVMVSCDDKWFDCSKKVETPDQTLKRAHECTRRAREEEEQCCICLADFTEDSAVALHKCVGFHPYHPDCIKSALTACSRCPVCLVVYGAVIGTQPRGTMRVTLSEYPNLPGHIGNTIVIMYHFPSGIQQKNHPNPGICYSGTDRTAYLPDSKEGREILVGFMKAWDSRVLFTVGQSVTTGCDNVVVWNGIHHKTSASGGPYNFGYPDKTYLDRVRLELSCYGIDV